MKDYKLDDLFEIQIGKTPSRSEPSYWGVGSTWVSIKDLNNLEDSKWIIDSKEQITNSAISDSNLKIVPANTILYSFKLSIGKVAINKYPLYTNEAIAAFIPKGVFDFDLDYVFHLLKFQDYSNLSNDAVMGKSLNKEKLKNIIISLPDLDEQKKISRLLNKSYYLISKRKKTINLLEEFIEAYFEELFGDPIINTKGFKLSSSKDIVFKNGYAFKSEDYTDDGVPLIKIGEANSKLIKDQNLSFLPDSFVNLYSDYLLKNGDFVISLTGTYEKNDYGHLNIVKSKIFDSFFLNQRVAKVDFNEEVYSYYFVYYLFNHKNCKKLIQSVANGVRQANISTNILSKKKFIIPSKILQDKFTNACIKVARLIEKLESSLELIDELNTSLLHRYFNPSIKPDIEEDDSIDILINDDFEVEKLLLSFLSEGSFENKTQYNISSELLLKVLEKTDIKNKGLGSDKFRKGIVQKFDGEKLQLLTNKEYKNEID